LEFFEEENFFKLKFLAYKGKKKKGMLIKKERERLKIKKGNNSGFEKRYGKRPIELLYAIQIPIDMF
jgi:hypothetical protein